MEKEFLRIFMREFCKFLDKYYSENCEMPYIKELLQNSESFRLKLERAKFAAMASEKGIKLLCSEFGKISEEIYNLHKMCEENGMKHGIYFFAASWFRSCGKDEIKKWLEGHGYSALATENGIKILSGIPVL